MSTTPIKIKIGTDDLAKLRLESTVLVDKSLFIKEFLEDTSDVVLLTRPRRWGKSLNMDMLGRFLALEVDAQGGPSPPSSLPQPQALCWRGSGFGLSNWADQAAECAEDCPA